VRINAPPPPVFSVPETPAVGVVGEVRSSAAVRAVEVGTGGAAPATGSLARSYEPAPTPTGPRPTYLDRRADESARRAEDRRQRSIPVLIDTRSGRDRRRGSRRERDAETAPVRTGIDIKA
jgi:hypothetical protein